MSLVYPALPHGRANPASSDTLLFLIPFGHRHGKSNKESKREVMTMRSRTRHDECPFRMQDDIVSGLVQFLILGKRASLPSLFIPSNH